MSLEDYGLLRFQHLTKAFIRSVIEYGNINVAIMIEYGTVAIMIEYGNINVATMGASATQLSRLDTVQNAAATLCVLFHFSVVVMLPQIKLLDCRCLELLHTFCLNFSLPI